MASARDFRLLMFSLLLAMLPLSIGYGQVAEPKKIALLVGVRHYDKPGFEELPGAENDAKALGEELKKLGFDVHVLLGSGAGDARATLANLRSRLKSLTKPLTKQDIFIVALAGHGQQLETSDSEKRTLVGDYFCPVGAVAGDPDTMLPLDEVLSTVGGNVGRGLIFVDACRDEPDDPNRAVGGRKARIRSRGIQGRQISVPSGMAIFFSCAERQRAFEHPMERHGLFTYCLLEELRRTQGNVVWLNLAAAVSDRMASEDVAKLLPKGRLQTPVLASNVGRVVLGSMTRRQSTAVPNVNRTPPAMEESKKPNSPAVVETQPLRRNWLQPLNVRTTEEAERKRIELQRDAENGDVAAMVRLGATLFRGDAWTVIDKDAADGWLRRAVATNDPLALVVSGVHDSQDAADRSPWEGTVRRGFEGMRTPNEADTLAQFYLGRAHHLGVGTVQDKGAALTHYQKAAAAGEPAAMDFIGWEYQEGGPSEQQTAVEWYRKAADQGLAGAMDHLGWCFEKGLGVPQDYTQAVAWYSKAASLGNPPAMDHLGLCYEYGRGAPKDITEAVRWYTRGAHLGHENAMCNVGVCLARVPGVPRDLNTAVSWFQKSAAKGHPRAMNMLAYYGYEQGHGLPPDRQEAIRLYRASAAKGNTDALNHLRRLGASP